MKLQGKHASILSHISDYIQHGNNLKKQFEESRYDVFTMSKDQQARKFSIWKEAVFSWHRVNIELFRKVVSDDIWISRYEECMDAEVTFEGLERSLIVLKEAYKLIQMDQSHQDQVQTDKVIDPTQVFIVHGREQSIKQSVARFLEQSGLNPVILHEKASGGRTLIEKIETHSNVGFAIIILTPDDLGKLKTEDGLHQRARQNVIFEFGYFAGKIGRNRTCALYQGDIELPSDLDGLVYVKMGDGDGWKIDLAREMKSAGYKIELNHLIDDN